MNVWNVGIIKKQIRLNENISLFFNIPLIHMNLLRSKNFCVEFIDFGNETSRFRAYG